MSIKYALVISMFTLLLTACGEGEGESGFEGSSCPQIGNQTCHDNARYICKSTGWSNPDPCGTGGETCNCKVTQGVALCIDDNTGAAQCQ